MRRYRAHGVIGNSSWCCAPYPSGIGQERIKATVAALRVRNSVMFRDSFGGERVYIIEIKVDATEVSEYEVADCVCSLDWLSVVVKGVKKPWVLSCDQLA